MRIETRHLCAVFHSIGSCFISTIFIHFASSFFKDKSFIIFVFIKLLFDKSFINWTEDFKLRFF